MGGSRPSRRLSYLLRLWRAGNGDAPQWRLSLEDTRTHTLHGFEDLASLVSFLEEQLEGGAPAPSAGGRGGDGGE